MTSVTLCLAVRAGDFSVRCYNLVAFRWRFQNMRKILFVAATALLCQAAYAEDAVAPAPPPLPPPAASPAPAAPEPVAAAPAAPAAPAPVAAAPAAPAPAAAVAPDAAPKAAKPAKKRAAKGGGRNWQSDEARARAIASKYGVSW
jgi:hypothetical protein